MGLDLKRRVFRRLKRMSHWRCREPVIVFESDDWGLERRACSSIISGYGEPGEWADEETETAEDLSRLFTVLEAHRDCTGRPACFTANFVVTNPDWSAIERGGFTSYHEIPIHENEALAAKWLEGFEREVFLPQYHGRHHFWVESWLRDLRQNVSCVRQMFKKRCGGGLSQIKGQGWRYHSEYLDWHSDRELAPDELDARLDDSLKIFRRTFNFDSLSTIAPHYLFTPAVCQGWQRAGIRFIQGSGYRLLRARSQQPRSMGHCLGEHSSDRMLYLIRPIKFEPRPQRPGSGTKQALEDILSCFERQIPAVVDTHRINYTGPWREQSLRALDELLGAVTPFRPRFLTSVELGEAILQDGRYKRHWGLNGDVLTPNDPIWRRSLRTWFAGLHARVSLPFAAPKTCPTGAG